MLASAQKSLLARRGAEREDLSMAEGNEVQVRTIMEPATVRWMENGMAEVFFFSDEGASTYVRMTSDLLEELQAEISRLLKERG